MDKENEIMCIKAFQPFAQYRNPFTFYYAQTYPLPPKTTIIGMLQNLMGKYYEKDFWKLDVSVHGGFESYYWNYQQLIKGDIELKKIGNRIMTFNQGLPLYAHHHSQRSPVYQQEMFNGHLTIFIKGEKEQIQKITHALQTPRKVPYLGRSEDILYIQNIFTGREIKSDTKTVKSCIWLRRPTYIKKDKLPLKNAKYPVYSIPIEMKFVNGNISITNKSEFKPDSERKIKFNTVMYTGRDYVIRLQNGQPLEVTDYLLESTGERFPIIEEFGWL